MLEFARASGLGVLVNRPLNAILGQGMIRLADFPSGDGPTLKARAEGTLDSLVRTETEFETSFRPLLAIQQVDPRLQQAFGVGREIRPHLWSFQGWEHWSHVQEAMIWPRFVETVSALNRFLGNREDWREWLQRYTAALTEALDAVSLHYMNGAQSRSRDLADRLDAMDEALKASPTLSQKAIRAVASLPAVSCVLVGMRKPSYVQDAIAIMGQPRLKEADRIFREAGELSKGLPATG